MDKINCTQLKIKQRYLSYHELIFKSHIFYFKTRDKKFHKMNKNMVNVLSNLGTIIWHIFIKDLKFMSLTVDTLQRMN
jgi:hypothetical protein